MNLNLERAMATPPDGLIYVSGFSPPEEQAFLLRCLENLEYKHDVFRGQQLKRRYAQFGYAYVSTGRKLGFAAPMPEFLGAIIEKGLLYCPVGVRFDQRIITHYPKGAGIGWHTDASRFGECVMAISLSADAWLQFWPNGSEKPTYELKVAPGSLYVMLGTARWQYQHQIVPVKTVRYSLTFRHVSEVQVGNQEGCS
jgi:DNA oxidative demethylase